MAQNFMTSIDALVVAKEHRAQSLNLLSAFLSSQPPHLYQVLETSLLSHLLQCLQQDTSTTVIDSALTALVMLLPNMPSHLVPFLPSLFNIYARLLFWDKERLTTSESLGVNSEGQQVATHSSWERCSYSAELDGSAVPHLSHYFTILYGLYPLNFVDYIRKPQRYLRHANYAEDVEVQPTEIRDRSERFRKHHLLHPNFYSLTIETEKTDFGRWMKAEPADVVAECTALQVASGSASVQRHHFASSTDETRPVSGTADQALLDPLSPEPGASKEASIAAQRHSTSTNADSATGSGDKPITTGRPRKVSQSSHQSFPVSPEHRTSVVGADSPTLPSNYEASTSQLQLQDMIQSNRVIKSSLHQSLANDSVPSLALSHQESLAERSSVRLPLSLVPELHNLSSGDVNLQLSQLRSQILLLQNDLNFERYMKEQHLAHIGELRSRQIREARSEAELQNLVEMNRQLKKRLEDAKKSELKIKKEADHRRTMTTKWESEISGKLRVLREEQKTWTADKANLKRELEAAEDKYHRLRRLVAQAEDKELKAKQEKQAADIDLGEVERLKTEVQRLAELERTHQGKAHRLGQEQIEAAEAHSRAEKMSLELKARDYELEQANKEHETQIRDLEAKLADAIQDTAGKRKAEKLNAMVQQSLDASRVKYAELQKQYSVMTRKYTVLQASLMEMATNPSVSRNSNDGGLSSSHNDGDSDVGAAFSFNSVSTPVAINRTRVHRGFSDPEMLESSYNVTPPLDAIAAPAGATQRPSTPSGSGGTGPDSAALRNSPGQAERYYGRGRFPSFHTRLDSYIFSLQSQKAACKPRSERTKRRRSPNRRRRTEKRVASEAFAALSRW
jgi:hypothetical protein